MRFEWDPSNVKHVSEDHPERKNTIEEIESVFEDPYLIIKIGTKNGNEQRFNAVGVGNSKTVRVVVFTISNGSIRPISSWPANKQTIRYYHENIQAR